MSDYVFPGFDALSYTPIPDIFLDELMSHLSEAELRVALYIMRRTFGFKKRADDISLNQMVNGITTREGKALDSGCGVQRAAVIRAVRGLEEKGVVVAQRHQSAERGNHTTTYLLRFRGDPKETPPGIQKIPAPVIQEILPLGSAGSPQETGIQDDRKQETDPSTSSDQNGLEAAIDEATKTFGRPQERIGNRTRARSMMAQAGITEEAMALCIRRAQSRLQGVVTYQGGVENRMAYFFSVLQDLLDQQRPPSRGDLAGRYAGKILR